MHADLADRATALISDATRAGLLDPPAGEFTVHADGDFVCAVWRSGWDALSVARGEDGVISVGLTLAGRRTSHDGIDASHWYRRYVDVRRALTGGGGA